jgi:hypothetical protein
MFQSGWATDKDAYFVYNQAINQIQPSTGLLDTDSRGNRYISGATSRRLGYSLRHELVHFSDFNGPNGLSLTRIKNEFFNNQVQDEAWNLIEGHAYAASLVEAQKYGLPRSAFEYYNGLLSKVGSSVTEPSWSYWLFGGYHPSFLGQLAAQSHILY